MLNIGIIGMGRIGRIHAENIARNFQNVRIKGIADLYLNDEMILWAKNLGIQCWLKCYGDLLADNEIHAIFICSPTSTHCDIAIDCIRSNKHVFCEKPLGSSIREIYGVILEFEKSSNTKLKFQIGFNRRFDHNFQAIRAAIESKQVGQPYILRLTSRDPSPPSLNYVKLSGGIFFDMTIHDFDMARYLLDDDIIEVHADGDVLFDLKLRELADIDTAVITMKMSKGAFVIIDNSRQAVYGYDQRAEVFGSKGQATITNDTCSSIIVSNNEGIHSEKPLQCFLERYKQSYITEIQQFFNAVLNDNAVPVTIYDGLQAMSLVRSASAKKSKKEASFNPSDVLLLQPTTMKLVIILCVLFVGAYCAPVPNEQLNDQWNSFKKLHGKKYNFVEEGHRRSIWEANLAKIQKHNQEANSGIHTYTVGMNEYGDLTDEEFQNKMNGFKMLAKSETTNFDNQRLLFSSNGTIPDAVDWRRQGYVTPVKNQGQCGSCWAFSATGALEGQYFARTKSLVSLSEQNLVDCSGQFGNMGCSGGLMTRAFQYIQYNQGINTRISYPYEARNGICRFQIGSVGATSSGFVNIPSMDEYALQVAISNIGPISVAIDASHSSFQFYRSGVYNEQQCSSTQLNHGVLVVGYATSGSQQYYIVKNSWGTSWGQQGYILMSRNSNNQCGIATMASYPLV
ncbi:unnamed protein product [Rotaria sp. Silwood1]|nr:unnamed protein product [Rotaria sp. Silwood1]